MTDAIRAALFRELHRSIAKAADAGVSRIAQAVSGTEGSGPVLLNYPPGDAQTDNHVLTQAEASALASNAASEAAMTGLRKLLQEAACSPVFRLFCLLDGVADPEGWNGDTWLGADLVPPQEDEHREMLHDAFLESYWDFVER